jgi:hypothetical protein
MLRWTRRRREALSETLRELANLTLAALVLGQAVGTEPPILWLLVMGGVAWVALVLVALLLVRND